MMCQLSCFHVIFFVAISYFIHFSAYMMDCTWVITGNTEWSFKECCNDSLRENFSYYEFDKTKGYIRAVFVLKTIAFATSFCALVFIALGCLKRYLYPFLAAPPGVFLASAVIIFAINYQNDSTFLQYGTPNLAFGFWLQVPAVLWSCVAIFISLIYVVRDTDEPSNIPCLFLLLCKTIWRLWKTKKRVSVTTRKREKTPQSSVITSSARSTDCPAETTSPDVKDLSPLQNYDISLSIYGLVMFPHRLYQYRSSPPPPYDVAVVDVNMSPPSYRSLWSPSPSIHHDTTSTVV